MEIAKPTNYTEISQILLEGESYFRISNSDALRPFFMSIVSDSNHWMFISSNGGLTAGRQHSEKAIFPYYTDDKISESAEITGSKTIIRVQDGGKTHVWEPFSERFEGKYEVTRNLYKNEYGNKIIFEETNHDLNLTFRYQWSSSDTYGFVRRSTLVNHAHHDANITLLDGLQNIMPYGVPSDLQMRSSNLVDAYKRSELQKDSGLGIFALSAIIVDKAEPSEALKANVVWSLGVDDPTYLLSSAQLKNFRKGIPIQEELDVKAEKGAYFIHTSITLEAKTEAAWMIVADVNKDHSYTVELAEKIKNDQDLASKIKEDIESGSMRLAALVAAADGFQQSKDQLRNARHFSNTLFNIMRGGIFDLNYQIEKGDFSSYLAKANKLTYKTAKEAVDKLPEIFLLSDLKALAAESKDPNFKRLALEYMPLKFSRRHGDPSRPWNKFSINTQSEIDGSKILDYEGNWRDIFQNWEALAYSYPSFIESMIHKFLNATTFDGYNPYRVTKGGFDWEIIEPDDPWSYIGYWGDHQIIYLLKLLEFFESSDPGKLEQYFNESFFVYANVPYRIKSFKDTLKNPKDTIDFDEHSDHQIREKRDAMGADGALHALKNGGTYQVNFIEKILATLLAKLSNFIPEGGIWMNTQRPEWNDANNALVGNGVSMVTLYYLRRFLNFFRERFAEVSVEKVEISTELADFFEAVAKTFEKNQYLLQEKINDKDRYQILEGVGEAGSKYRLHIYDHAFSGEKRSITLQALSEFVELSLKYLDHSIRANKRSDDLYHAYNLMTVEKNNEVSIAYLSEMLEGQVAVLSAGSLTSEEAVSVLDGLKASSLFRDDQYSYILYPNKNLPQFSERNNISQSLVDTSSLLKELVEKGNTAIISQDIRGDYHFNGNFKNAGDLAEALGQLSSKDYASLTDEGKESALQVFEEIFDHKSFTGRSGTFFGYEGLGSIYWHMVSKLQLAVMECCIKAFDEGASEETKGRLVEHYYEINAGIGVHKSPSLYGAFPTDPYSHTPAGKGAQQPGMTGQVKEDILSRFGELGIRVEKGKLTFKPSILRKEEFLTESQTFAYIDIHQAQQEIELGSGMLGFTFCQIPIIFQLTDQEKLHVTHQDGIVTTVDSLSLNEANSKDIFERTGNITQIHIQLNQTKLL